MGMKRTSEQPTTKALVRHSHDSLVPTDHSARVTSRMTAGVLDVMRRGDNLATAERHRVGDIELDGPNYRQMLRWAKQRDCSVEDMADALQVAYEETNTAGEASLPMIDDGAIKGLVFDNYDRGISRFEWEPGLRIEALRIVCHMPAWLPSEVLPSLRALELPADDIEKFDLSVVPQLTWLWCSGLTELVVSPAPNLTTLGCYRGELTDLDLSAAPNLMKLYCPGNRLTKLDLSPAPNLTNLDCSDNELTALNLLPVPNLRKLNCADNNLTALDLSPMPNLTHLDFGGNQLTELDLSPALNLQYLTCHRRGFNKMFHELNGGLPDNPGLVISGGSNVHIMQDQ